MARSWLIDGTAIAKEVKNASWSSDIKIIDYGANRECPNCHFTIDNSDVSPQWPGLPVGVKFDPSDAELLEHLAAKRGVGNSKAHLFIDEFIPTLDLDQGICYTHPENLPGAKKDGRSIHFFYRTVNAYGSGKQKRRKIQKQDNTNDQEHVRWHRTGKTKPVMESGVQKGWKKIMVLYKTKKGTKPEKSNWVMHQLHLGSEEEHDGEYVVSRISYQQQQQNQTDKNGECPMVEEPDNLTSRASPRTSKRVTPNPPFPCKSMIDDDPDDNMHQIPLDTKFAAEGLHLPPLAVQSEDDLDYPAWSAGESQAAEIDNSLLCTIGVTGNNDASCGIYELQNLEFDTPPDLPFADLLSGKHFSRFDWL